MLPLEGLSSIRRPSFLVPSIQIVTFPRAVEDLICVHPIDLRRELCSSSNFVQVLTAVQSLPEHAPSVSDPTAGVSLFDSINMPDSEGMWVYALS